MRFWRLVTAECGYKAIEYPCASRMGRVTMGATIWHGDSALEYSDLWKSEYHY